MLRLVLRFLHRALSSNSIFSGEERARPKKESQAPSRQTKRRKKKIKNLMSAVKALRAQESSPLVKQKEIRRRRFHVTESSSKEAIRELG